MFPQLSDLLDDKKKALPWERIRVGKDDEGSIFIQKFLEKLPSDILVLKERPIPLLYSAKVSTVRIPGADKVVMGEGGGEFLLRVLKIHQKLAN